MRLMRGVGRVGTMCIALIAIGAGLAACDDGKKIETSKLEKSFSSAPPASKSAMEDLKSAITAEDYAKAGAALQKLASSVNLTPDQKKAIEDMAAQVKDVFAQKAKDVAKEVVKEGEKAFEDVKKKLSN